MYLGSRTTPGELYGASFFQLFFKTSYLNCLGERRTAVLLWRKKCFEEYETSPDFPSAWGEEMMTEFYFPGELFL